VKGGTLTCLLLPFVYPSRTGTIFAYGSGRRIKPPAAIH
jgi:hypothetical protein